MNVLVSGGTGLKGAAIVRYLVDNTNMNVLNVDSLNHASGLSTIEKMRERKRYRFEKIDVLSTEDIGRIFIEHKPNYVLNLSSETHIDRSSREGKQSRSNNLGATYAILNVARAYWNALSGTDRNTFQFLHVYSDGATVAREEKDNKLHLVSSAKSNCNKLVQNEGTDHLVRAWNRTYGLPVQLIHCSSEFDPKVVLDWFLQCINDHSKAA